MGLLEYELHDKQKKWTENANRTENRVLTWVKKWFIQKKQLGAESADWLEEISFFLVTFLFLIVGSHSVSILPSEQ